MQNETEEELTPDDCIIYEVHCWAMREADRQPNLDDGEIDHPERGIVHGMVCYDAESRAGQCCEYSCPMFEGVYFSRDPTASTAYFEIVEEEENPPSQEVRGPDSFSPNPAPHTPPTGIVHPLEAMGQAAKNALAATGSQIIKDVVTEGLKGAVDMSTQAVKDTAKSLFTTPSKDTSE